MTVLAPAVTALVNVNVIVLPEAATAVTTLATPLTVIAKAPTAGRLVASTASLNVRTTVAAPAPPPLL